MPGGSRCSKRRHDQALIELEEAERLDPLDLQVKTQIGYVHYFRHDLDRAIAQFEKVPALEPSFAFAHYALGDAAHNTVNSTARSRSSTKRSSWADGRSTTSASSAMPTAVRKPRPRERTSPGVDGARRGRATSRRCGSRWSTLACRISKASSAGWTAPSRSGWFVDSDYRRGRFDPCARTRDSRRSSRIGVRHLTSGM